MYIEHNIPEVEMIIVHGLSVEKAVVQEDYHVALCRIQKEFRLRTIDFKSFHYTVISVAVVKYKSRCCIIAPDPADS